MREFLVHNVPHSVLIGTANVYCRQLHEDLQKVCDDILEHDPQVSTTWCCVSLDATAHQQELLCLPLCGCSGCLS